MSASYIISIIIMILCFIPALVFHEVMHGYAAYKLGDPTAKSQGRLSLNPLKHIDPFGSVILPGLMILMGGPVFGYAKPVPYNPEHFKDPRKGDVIVGLAGPFANLAMACLAALIAWILWPIAPSLVLSNELFALFYVSFLPMFALINLYIMFFNILPIPPLDGSSIFALFVPVKYLPKYYQIQRYALPVFFVVLIALPYIFNISPISWYFGVTANNLANLLFPFAVA